MNVLIARLTLVLSIAAACAACFTGAAGAAAQVDPGGQGLDLTLLPRVHGVTGQVAGNCDIDVNKLHVSGRFGPNTPTLPTIWNPGQKLGVASVPLKKLASNQLGVAKVSWRMQPVSSRSRVIAQDFDDGGGFTYVTQPVARSRASRLTVFRVLPNGGRRANFGDRGVLHATVDGLKNVPRLGVRAIAQYGGGVLLIAQAGDKLVLRKYRASGRPDPRWGANGEVSLRARDHGVVIPPRIVDSAAPLPDGGLLIAAYGAPGRAPSSTLGVLRLTNRGVARESWADKGFWTPPAAAAGTQQLSLLAAPTRMNGFAIAYANYTDDPQLAGIRFSLRVAMVSRTGGRTTSDAAAGEYFNGGDAGFPDATPWSLGESKSGVTFVHADSYFNWDTGTVFGAATRLSPTTGQPAASIALDGLGLATSAVATDPARENLYLCGADGLTSQDKATAQRKRVAIGRLTL